MRLYYDQLIGILLCWLLSFWIIRWYLRGINLPIESQCQKEKEKRRNYPGVVFLYQIPAGDS